MTKFMASMYLILKLICQRIEMDPNLVLVMWCNRPAIEIYEPGSSRQNRQFYRTKNIVRTEHPIVGPLAWNALNLPPSSVQGPYIGRPLHL